MPFDPFRRFRPRNDGSEHVAPRPKSVRKSVESTRIPFTLDKPSNKSGVASVVHPIDALHAAKPTLIRRVTSKLNIISIPARSGNQLLRSRPSTRTLPGDTGPPRPNKHPIPDSPTLPNSFVSRQHREAALRERGLIPPCKDLSEQEREADERLGSIPSPASLTFNGTTEAQRLKAIWLASNRAPEGSDSELSLPPSLQASSPDADLSRRSCEGKTDLPPAGRPSFCSSVTSMPPLSTSSYLEVLHEEPSEQGPITPPPLLLRAIPPVIVSSSLDPPPSPIFVESPISCAFSSYYPGSTFESHSQSSYPRPIPERASICSAGSRRRTSDLGDRPRKVVGSSLSKFGTHSLTNLRRSVAGSLRAPSSSTLSTADHSSSSIAQAPRAAIDPTMHSLGSIIRETKDIKDAESRRLSELAFLD